ncbi:hypothetical protein [Pedobacter nyackensis]|uniref:hypothetical protein n=1 Tax=Pedobacter nyackensis TaxID=475255 RepID=UPI0029300B53|nr:hypothetical protein [Pedobacter nyackensis]
MRSVIYELNDKYKIVTYSQLPSGIWSATSSIDTIWKEEATFSYFEKLLKILNASNNKLKEKDALSTPDFYNLLGLKKGTKIEKVAKSFMVILDNDNLSFIPNKRNDKRTHYLPQFKDKLDYSLKDDYLDVKRVFIEVLNKCD